ncbi:MAG TPA: hypothetical protein PLN41_06945 [Methanothrix sp.]|nr:hypothetical protein [Methanothrix sp.]
MGEAQMQFLNGKDFTIHKFKSLCEAIVDNYPTITMAEYVEGRHPERFVIMRHDVDRMPGHALETARIEEELGIGATYYFRAVNHVFKPDIIRQIRDLGHEIGYHYETLSEANGDYNKAIGLFQSDLNKFRAICEVQTICMHGRPLSKYDNRDLWNAYDFMDFGIVGEAYLSAGKELNYFSDTGRSWSNRNNLRDFIPDKIEAFTADSTSDLSKLIDCGKLNNFYILTHPERWSLNIGDWVFYYGLDMVINAAKRCIAALRRGQDEHHIVERELKLR